MSQWAERRERFRAILNGTACVHPGSVYDAMSARIAQHVGYEIGMVGGSSASLAVLGAPDLIVMTLTEFAEQCLRMNRASELPIMVDADHGYGNALNVMRTVEELENAGVAALSIEDTELPQPFGADGPRLISIEEGVGKMRAALEARRDPGFVIAGRTSAVMISGLDDAIARAQAYQQAGVDALFFVGVRRRDQLDALAEALRVPIILGGAGPDLLDLDYLSSRGVRVCLQGHQPFAAAVRAVHDTLKALREGTRPAELEGIASRDLMRQVTRDEDFQRWIDSFLRD